ncbi:MAG TPA: glycosyltransferase [Ktedonobacteraceae bacterium]|jgi:GT2 family glycosyltransferase|nr:glycosyltransferase [Ktedonobacteraceae bacterium]
MSISINTGVRPCVQGKFLFVDEEKLYVRGVTYGTFRLDEDGNEWHDPEVTDRDFAMMVANGVNAIRTYTVPPRWLLDMAQRHGLYVMVGLPWEQHVAFLDEKKRAASIEERVRKGVRDCAGHPAVLCYTIGNEIPSSIVRWYGHRRIERFLERLYHAAKAEDPGGLVTYVNFPSTEYLELPFLDFVAFNVYLESQKKLQAYLARLQNIAGNRPLLMAEMGLDSRRNGEEKQAETLDWQIRTIFAGGCAGAFVFAWTDEWYRGGYEIDDWDFGITTRNREPKPALESVRKAYGEVPFPADLAYPRISVIVCSYNGQRTLRDCLEGLLKLEYPDYEIILVNDGSTDLTAAIGEEYGVRVITTANNGLSKARNTGLEAATGEIVAYIDDDARPDPHWLTYLAATFMRSEYAGVGGPNIAPPGDGLIADCVANAPGGPVHVLLSDQEAEHIPGCNMAFRKSHLQAIGGFDPQFRIAGDDVDVCWRLQQCSWKLGFNPAAMVWHHRRNSVRTYWKQQKNYGKAEALLERKWPEKYNAAGHLAWAGRLYSPGVTRALNFWRSRIYSGTWGSALFQSVYQPAPGTFWSLALMPEWYLILLSLAGLFLLGIFWPPLLSALILLILASGLTVVQAWLSAIHASFSTTTHSRFALTKLYSLTILLHLLQPPARLCGRLSFGLAPWRWRGVSAHVLPRPQISTIWSEQWQDPLERLRRIEASIHALGSNVRRGSDYDRWDLEVCGGIFGTTRTRMAVEEHGAGRQLLRFRLWPRCSFAGLALILLFGLLSTAAMFAQAWSASAVLGIVAILLAVRVYEECANAMATLLRVLKHPHKAVKHTRVPGREALYGKIECEQPQGSSINR